MFRVVLFCACVALVSAASKSVDVRSLAACSCVVQQTLDLTCENNILFKGETIYDFVDSDTTYYVVRVDEAYRMPSSLTNAKYLLATGPAEAAACDTLMPTGIPYLFRGSDLRDGALRILSECHTIIEWNKLPSGHLRYLASFQNQPTMVKNDCNRGLWFNR